MQLIESNQGLTQYREERKDKRATAVFCPAIDSPSKGWLTMNILSHDGPRDPVSERFRRT